MVGDDDAIARLLVRSDARESDADCHGSFGSSCGLALRALGAPRYFTVM